jgi:hypothetical protein
MEVQRWRPLSVNLKFLNFTVQRLTKSGRTQKNLNRAIKDLSIDVHLNKIGFEIRKLYIFCQKFDVLICIASERKTRKGAAPKSESAVLLRIGKTEEALVRVKLPCSVYIMGRCVIEHLRLLTSSANFIRKVARTSLFLEELHSIFFT